MASRVVTPSYLNGDSVALPTLRLVRTSRFSHTLASLLMVTFLISPIAMLFIPWRQTISGQGRVVGFTPVDREQTIDSSISGRIVHWYVIEGSRVSKGDRVARMTDIDPEFLSRLERQKEAAEDRLDAAEMRIDSFLQVIKALEAARVMAIEAARENIEIARQRVEAIDNDLTAAQAVLAANTIQYDRVEKLYREGLESRRAYELSEQNYLESGARVQRLQADLRAANNDVQVKSAELKQLEATTQGAIDSAQADLQNARREREQTRNELIDIEARLSRQQSQVVVAPRDGTILRLIAPAEGMAVVSQGAPIALMVPDAAQMAAEIWVDGNDAPLITRGVPVRLQFEGWPAVQFVGWPSVAIGTFGGIVALVDATDVDGSGRFRILVVPDGVEDWPSPRFLRQGVRAKGWVLLNEVTLGYEIWRRINGFPPVIAKDEPGRMPIPEQPAQTPQARRPS